jgi:hypothetical protein
LYADDVALFAKPSSVELSRLQKILIFFGECSGLKVNMSKTEIFPIRMQPSALESLLRDFPGKISAFPGKYLGLPLHTRKFRMEGEIPLIVRKGNIGENRIVSSSYLSPHGLSSTKVDDKKDRSNPTKFFMAWRNPGQSV